MVINPWFHHILNQLMTEISLRSWSRRTKTQWRNLISSLCLALSLLPKTRTHNLPKKDLIKDRKQLTNLWFQNILKEPSNLRTTLTKFYKFQSQAPTGTVRRKAKGAVRKVRNQASHKSLLTSLQRYWHLCPNHGL